jgi:cytochrome c-type biogenesis protein
MIFRVFGFFTHVLELGPLFALVAAFGWGVLSILLSPCHLTSIPLVIGYLAGRKGITRGKIAGTVLVFSFGILFTVGVIGLVTYSMGRLVGDLGSWGNYLVGAIFIVIGVYLIGLLKMPAVGVNVGPGFEKGYLGALILGLVCGFALGPCTFAYLAPILGVVFRQAASNPGFSGLLLASYAAGHTAVILLAGLLYGKIERYLNWAADKRRGGLVKKVCGFLILAGGCYLLYQAVSSTVLV